MFACLFVCLFVCLFIYLFTYLLIYLFTYLLIYLFTYLLIYLFTYLLIYLFTYLFCFVFSTHIYFAASGQSRDHRCRPFFPPVLAFNFHGALGSAIPLPVVFHGVLRCTDYLVQVPGLYCMMTATFAKYFGVSTNTV